MLLYKVDILLAPFYWCDREVKQFHHDHIAKKEQTLDSDFIILIIPCFNYGILIFN
jgi:hypothetical protein